MQVFIRRQTHAILHVRMTPGWRLLAEYRQETGEYTGNKLEVCGKIIYGRVKHVFIIDKCGICHVIRVL